MLAFVILFVCSLFYVTTCSDAKDNKNIGKMQPSPLFNVLFTIEGIGVTDTFILSECIDEFGYKNYALNLTSDIEPFCIVFQEYEIKALVGNNRRDRGTEESFFCKIVDFGNTYISIRFKFGKLENNIQTVRMRLYTFPEISVFVDYIQKRSKIVDFLGALMFFKNNSENRVVKSVALDVIKGIKQDPKPGFMEAMFERLKGEIKKQMQEFYNSLLTQVDSI